MAESDTRLETLEDEVKVLKGEVKRTLVDLRALLMREDSPLVEGSTTRRTNASDQGQDKGRANKGTTATASAPMPGLNTEDASPGNAGLAMEGELTEASLGLPTDDLPGAPPESGPVPGVLPGVSTANHAGQLADAKPAQASLDSADSGGDKGLTDQPSRHPDQKAAKAKEESKGEQTRKSPGRNGHGHSALGVEEAAANADSSGQNGKVSNIYDEYRELLEETRQTQTIEDSPVGPPLDINLLSNLVYWTALAKQRVGEAQLKNILQLYIQSGHSRPELQDLLLQISDMVDAGTVEVNEGLREWVDLMFHLHGILTGGFPVIKLPQIRLPLGDKSEGDRG